MEERNLGKEFFEFFETSWDGGAYERIATQLMRAKKRFKKIIDNPTKYLPSMCSEYTVIFGERGLHSFRIELYFERCDDEFTPTLRIESHAYDGKINKKLFLEVTEFPRMIGLGDSDVFSPIRENNLYYIYLWFINKAKENRKQEKNRRLIGFIEAMNECLDNNDPDNGMLIKLEITQE